MTRSDSSLRQLVTLVSRRWSIVLTVAIAAVVGTTVYVGRQPDQYDASAVVSVLPRPATPNPDLVRIGAPRYLAFITAPATISQVAAKLGEDPADLRRRVKATVATDTGNITITVRALTPHAAMTAADALARRLERTASRDKLLQADIVAPADRPRAPAAPPRRLLQAGALAAGLLAGMGLAALLDWCRTTLGRPQAFTADRFRGPLLDGYHVVGHLPWSSVLQLRLTSMFGDPALLAAGEVLMANLDRDLGEGGYGVIVVTSPPGRHGRTTTAQLLASLLARSGRPVLLVAAQRDHPDISRSLAPRGPRDDEVRMGQARSRTSHQLGWIDDLWMLEDGLWVLPAWHGSEGGGLSAEQLTRVLQDARDLFRTVVVDSPPLLGSDVARTLSWLADAVLLVLSNLRTAEPVQDSLTRLLHGADVPFVGVVLNQVREPTSMDEPRSLGSLPPAGY